MVSQLLFVSANPDTFTCAAFGRRLGVVWVEFLFDDFGNLLDGQVCLRVPSMGAGDADVAQSAIEVR